MKKAFVVLLSFVLFIVLAVVVMWIFKICPPEGPWPMPPWCTSSLQDGSSSSSASKSSSSNSNTSTSNSSINTSSPAEIWKQPQQNLDMVSSSDFTTSPDAVSKIATGHTFMDIYNTFLVKNRFESSIKSMKGNNAQWVILDDYWSYHSLNPPVIAPYGKVYEHSFRHATEEELAKMIQTTHDNGMKFALMAELNFDVAMGTFTTWEANQKFWDESKALLQKMGDGLDAPTAEVNSYWDEWFKQYTEYMLSHARIAEKYKVEMLVIGKQIDGAVRKGNTARWKKLITQVRAVYKGPIGYAGFTHNDYSQFQDAGFIADLDYIIIYMYNNVGNGQNPSVAELKASFETIIDKQADRYFKETGKKVILLTPFQSREYGAKQEWFEPAAPAPDVRQDLLIQAKMYEALFQALTDEKSVEMVWTWGYWWLENDFNRDEGSPASFEKSSSVRNKPAAEVIRRWSE